MLVGSEIGPQLWPAAQAPEGDRDVRRATANRFADNAIRMNDAIDQGLPNDDGSRCGVL